MHGDQLTGLGAHRVRQDAVVGLVQDGELAPADLGGAAVGGHEEPHEGQQRVGTALLVGDVDVLGREGAGDDRQLQVCGLGVGEPAVRSGCPLHGGADGRTSGERRVLAHPDLLAVVEDRGPGEREHQAVDHAYLAGVLEHGRHPAGDPAVVDALRLLRGEGVEHLLPLGLAELVQGQLVVVADEVGPLVGGRDGRTPPQGRSDGAGVLTGQRQEQLLVGDEVDLHAELVAVITPEERELLGEGQVDLAQQHGRAAAPAHVLPQGVEQLVLPHALGLDEERHGVDAEPVDAQLQPEPDDLGDLLDHGRVARREVGLVAVEGVLVVLPGHLVVAPDAVLGVGEHARPGVGRGLVAPEVEVAVAAVAVAAGRLEPRVLVGGVVDDQVDDDADAAVVGGADHLDEVAQAAVPRVDAVVVADVVAVVAAGRGVQRGEPETGHPEVHEVVQAVGQTVQVAHAVVVPVGERRDVAVVEDRGLPPQVAGVGQPHRTRRLIIAAGYVGRVDACGRGRPSVQTARPPRRSGPGDRVAASERVGLLGLPAGWSPVVVGRSAVASGRSLEVGERVRSRRG